MKKAKRNMQDKKLQYRGYLIIGLVITFLLVGDITYTDDQRKSSATVSSKQHELRDINTLHSLQLNLRLAGTIIASEENSYAIIEDETTGKQGMYKIGESINEVTVLKIDRESIIVEKDGTDQVLRIKGRSSSEMLSEDVPPSTDVSKGLPYFKPGLGTSSASSAPKGKPAFPVLSLRANVQGEMAIEALDDKLPEVAAWYGSTPEEFATMLREDHTARISTDGHLFYIDEFPEHTTEDETSSVSAASFPYDQTFNLHSLPGSKRVIYIDFNGHTTTGTVWNLFYGDPIISPAFDLDGNPSSFSNAELDRIQAIWKRVSEDYAPFDVDVTTEDPGQDAIIRSSSSDEHYGTRVVMTVDNFAGCGCGGFAYVRVFDNVGDYYKPAFVFNKTLAGAAEAVSHEAGHNLGLFHDGVTGGDVYYQGQGSGATGWAPIMGVGYYKQLVQWSKGEYTNANNTQDDIQIIQDNGALIIADDHGNDQANASALDNTTTFPVTWVNVVGMSIDGNSLTKTASAAWGNGGAASSQSFTGNGGAEFVVTQANTNRMFGLSSANLDANYATIEYAIYLEGTGVVHVYENGLRRGNYGSYKAGDSFKVERAGSTIVYKKNGVIFYTSATSTDSSLLVDVAIGDIGGKISDARLTITTDTGNAVTTTNTVSDVTWVDVVGMSVDGNSLTKTASAAWGNGGAASSQSFTGNGGAEFVVTQANTNRMFGLSSANLDANWNTIEYAIYLEGTGVSHVIENGYYQGAYGSCQMGDSFKVERAGSTIVYRKNGIIFYTSATTTDSPLLVDVAIGDIGGKISDARLTITTDTGGVVTWVDVVGMSVDGNSLTKTAPAAWGNGGAASSQSFTGNGGAEFVVTQANTNRMFGLSSTNLDANWNTIGYAIYLEGTGACYVYENGQNKGAFGVCQVGDVFRVERSGSTIVYRKNGDIFHTSAIPTDSALLVDVAIGDTGGKISNAKLIITTDTEGTVTSMNTGDAVTLNGKGFIERRTDIDFFHFVSGNGNISITIDPAPLSPNLDILAKLYDSNGFLIATSNPVYSLSAYINETALPAGEYFISIEGTGKGDPLETGYTDYASLGQYSISGSISGSDE